MFIDIHVHTMSMAKLPWAPGSECPATPEQLIEMYDDVGIDRHTGSGGIADCVELRGEGVGISRHRV